LHTPSLVFLGKDSLLVAVNIAKGHPQREILSPLGASPDHLWATLFHRLPDGLGAGCWVYLATRVTAIKKYSYDNVVSAPSTAKPDSAMNVSRQEQDYLLDADPLGYAEIYE